MKIMAVPGIDDTFSAHCVYWWHIYNKNRQGFDFKKMYIDAFENPPRITFRLPAEAFADFNAKNSEIIAGETKTVHNQNQYVSGQTSKEQLCMKGVWGHPVILEKLDGTVAIILAKAIPEPSYISKKSCSVDPVILTELEELRRENAKLRIKLDPSKAPKRDTFYVPAVETLKNARDIANAFATFFGCFITSYSTNELLNHASPTGTGFCGIEYTENIHGIPCLLEFKINTKKEWAMLYPVARILGLTKETFQKRALLSKIRTTTSTSIEHYCVKWLLEHIEFDTDIKEQTYQMGFVQYIFKSNLPLLQYLYESVKNIPANEARIGEWVNCLDQEQAECMLRAMAATTTDTFTEIQTISPLLYADIHTLCRIAGYTYECENIFDRLWMYTIKKASIVAVTATTDSEVGNPS